MFRRSGRTAIFKQGTDGVDEGGAAGAQFADAMAGDLFQQFFPARKKRYKDAAAIVPAAVAAHIAVSFQAVDELNDAVVLEREPVGQCADGRFFAWRKAANRQEEQVLLGLEAGGASDAIAFADESANLIAKLRERLIFGRGDLPGHV